MSRLFSIVVQKWFLTLLVALAICLLIWFVGPLLDNQSSSPILAPAGRRLWVMSVVIAIWVAYWIFTFAFAAIRSIRIARGAAEAAAAVPNAESSAPRPGEEDVKALGKRFDEAIAILRKSKGAGFFSAQYLYSTPWYIFLGPPGSGKTTALVNSGLKFPLADSLGKNAVRGVGGTRNCDWWFTEEAVLLDTAGRFSTQDSDAEQDQAAWLGFLKLLKKNRKRRPINGAIVAVSAADLLDGADNIRQKQISAIRERIKELHEQLGIRFPIYVLVTKCDLLAGFSEYFDDLGRFEREQVFGFTLPLVGPEELDNAIKRLTSELTELYMRLEKGVYERMQAERDLSRRALIFNLPKQFANLQAPLEQYVTGVFGSSRYDQPALFRGVYFTSGTQEGNPIDRVVSGMAADLGIAKGVISQKLSGGKSFFITRLLKDVIFKESGLAGADLKFERKIKWIQKGVAICGVFVGIFLLVGMSVSLFRNRAYVNDIEIKIAKLEVESKQLGATPFLPTVLPFLASIRELPGGYADRERETVPFSMTFGLYQGNKLGFQASELYLRALSQIVQPRLIARLEDELNRGLANNSQALIEALRVYLMLGDPKRLDVGTAVAWADFDLAKSFPRGTFTPEQINELMQHHIAFANMVKQGEPVRLNSQVVAKARETLARTSLSERVYATLKSEVARTKVAEFSVAAAGGPNSAIALVRKSGEPLTRGVPGVYTVDGYQRLVKSLDGAIVGVVKDNWIYGKNESVASTGAIDSLKTQVLELYYADYIKAWDSILADVTIAPLSTLDAGARILNIVANPVDSPFKKFLQAVAKETSLGDKKANTLSDAVKGGLDAARKELMNKLGSSDATSPAGEAASNPVDRHFERLKRAVGTSADSAAAPIDQDLAQLKDAFVFMDAAALAKKQGTPSPPADVLPRLKRDSVGKPGPIAAIMVAVSDAATTLTVGGERSRLSALWSGSVAQFCRSAVVGRYPLVAASSQDIPPEDFGRLFSSGGLIDDFFQKNLVSFVDMSRPRWVWRQSGGVPLGIPQSTLDEFQRAATIRDAFFPNRSTQPTVRFDLRPLGDNSSIAQFIFELDGQTLQVNRGQGAAKRFQWPTGAAASQGRFEFTQNSGTTARGASAEGSWALFRLMEKGVLEATPQADKFRLTYENQGKRMVLEIQASSVINPFRLDTLRQFRCLDQL